MARTPKWKSLGLEKVGPGRYVDESGRSVSERQYRKLAGTPAKGSPGHAERMAAKAAQPPRQAASTRRPSVPSAPSKALTDFVGKKRGATLEWYKAGHEPRMSPATKQSADAVNREVDRQRQETIRLLEKTGHVTAKQAESLRVEARAERYWRNEMQRIADRLHTNRMPNGRPLTVRERERLNREYDAAYRKFEKARKPLFGRGVIPDKGSDYYAGYYH